MNLKDIVSSLDTRYERRIQGPTRGRCLGVDLTNKLAEVRIDSTFEQSSTVRIPWVGSPPVPDWDCKIFWDSIGNPIVIGSINYTDVDITLGYYTTLTGCTGTTTSSSYANYPGSITFSGTKHFGFTDLLFITTGEMYIS